MLKRNKLGFLQYSAMSLFYLHTDLTTQTEEKQALLIAQLDWLLDTGQLKIERKKEQINKE